MIPGQSANKSSEHYRGKCGHRYHRGRFTDQLAIGRRYQSRYFQPYCDNEKVILDFGCGDGTILFEVSAARKLAVEVNPYCVRQIEAANETADLPISVFPDLSHVGDDDIDVIISNHSLEHVPEPLSVLREMRRVLAAEGVLVLVTPFDDWRRNKGHEWAPDDPDNHLYTWSPKNIGNLLVEAGFKVESSRLQTTAWSPRFFWLRRKFGDQVFGAACWLFAWMRNAREVLSIARVDMTT